MRFHIREGPSWGPEAPAEVALADVLAQAVEGRPRVSMYLGEDHLIGELRSVGADVLAVSVDGQFSGLAYARLASVSEISFLDSG